MPALGSRITLATNPVCRIEVSQPGTRGQFVVTSGARAGRVIPFVHQGRPLTFGRGPDCAVQFETPSVSRLHARAVWIGDQHFLSDAGSTHGTFVNDSPARETIVLAPGDRIRLGPQVTMDFVVLDSQEEAALIKAETGRDRDPITGAFLRSHLEQALDAQVRKARSTSSLLSVIFVRLLEFEGIHRSLGRIAADDVIAGVCCLASSWIRGSDVVGRYDDDSVLLITPGAKLADATLIGERLLRDISAMSFSWQSQPLTIHVGIGVASLDCCGPLAEPRSLITLAAQRTEVAGRTHSGVMAMEGAAVAPRMTSESGR